MTTQRHASKITWKIFPTNWAVEKIAFVVDIREIFIEYTAEDNRWSISGRTA